MQGIAIILSICVIIIAITFACDCTATSSHDEAAAAQQHPPAPRFSPSNSPPPHHVANHKDVDIKTAEVSSAPSGMTLPTTSAHPINISSSWNIVWCPAFDPSVSGYVLEIANDSHTHTDSQQPDSDSEQTVDWSIDFIVNTSLALSTINIGMVTNAVEQLYENVTLTRIPGSKDLVSWQWKNLWNSCDFSAVGWMIRVTTYSHNTTSNVTSYSYLYFNIQPFLLSCYSNWGALDPFNQFSSVLPTIPDRAIVIHNYSSATWNVYLTQNPANTTDIGTGFILTWLSKTDSNYAIFQPTPLGLYLLPSYHPPGSIFSQFTTGEISVWSQPGSECGGSAMQSYALGNYVLSAYSQPSPFAMGIDIVVWDYQCYLQLERQNATKNNNTNQNNNNNNNNNNNDDDGYKKVIIISVVCSTSFLLFVCVVFVCIKRRRSDDHGGYAEV